MLAKAMFHENRPTIHTDFLFKGIAKVSNTTIVLLLNFRGCCLTKFIDKAAFVFDIINYKLYYKWHWYTILYLVLSACCA